MFGKVYSACVSGIDGRIIEVEVDLTNGLFQTTIVGLPDSAVRESVERVRAAIKNSGCRYPLERITVNLAPADLREEGSAFDLAIAAGILMTSGQLAFADRPERTLLIGELSLDGSLRPVCGVLSMVHAAREAGFEWVIVPAENAAEAGLLSGLRVEPIARLRDLAAGADAESGSGSGSGRPKKKSANRSGGDTPSQPAEDGALADGSLEVDALADGGLADGALADGALTDRALADDADFADVCGQYHAKRALMVAAAGMHNVLLVGPPGSGKTMLLRRLLTIMPPLAEAESLKVTKIYSVAGQLPPGSGLLRRRPFRSPHHTVSAAGLAGGGAVPRPGEASLAHRGVLFLDELPEFSRQALEALRQSLEDKRVTIGRAAVHTYPADFLLAAAMNPCPCGYDGTSNGPHACTCSRVRKAQYRARISGLLLDRIDLQTEVPRLEFAALHGGAPPLSSAEMRRQVDAAIRMQQRRYRGMPIRFNSQLHGRLLRETCQLDAEARQLLQAAFDTLGFSARSRDRILKMARTIADLAESDRIAAEHVTEALQYRKLDRLPQAQEVRSG